ncbi:MAG TPA: isoprenylcysteine carboxylmethyltransferase family protein [Polyangia bacterium]|nr:isoprenylcysteine carboxylmethyltransferase family protein [Polyangia bacterium]
MSETESKQGGARVSFPPPLVFVAGTAVGVALQHLAWPLRAGGARWLGATVGAAVGGAGAALIAWAMGFFKRTGQDPRPWKPSPSMIVDGPYRRTRNPMYVGMTLLQLGAGFALNDLWISLLAGASLYVVHRLAVLPEEAYLTARFGDAYRAYRGSVRRYL